MMRLDTYDSDRVRADWVRQVADTTQILMGAFTSFELETLKRALSLFERQCPRPRTVAEGLALRGLLLDAFLRLDTELQGDAPADVRRLARARLHEASLQITLSAFLVAARQLVVAADRAQSLPLHERTRRWIGEDVADHETVREIASRLGAHPRTLGRQFVKHAGVTVQQYRWKLRAARAAELLSNTDLKVEAVVHARSA